MKILIFFKFLLKTLIVDCVCFGSIIRKLGIPLLTLIISIYKWDLRGYTFRGHVLLMYKVDTTCFEIIFEMYSKHQQIWSQS